MKLHYSIVILLTVLFTHLLPEMNALAETQERTVTIGFLDINEEPNLHNMPYRETVIQTAIEFALKSWNEQSGNTNFEIKQFRYSKSPESLQLKIKELVEDSSVVMAVGPCTDDHSLAAAPYLSKHQLVSISPYASTTDLDEYKEYFWKYADSTKQEASAIQALVMDLNLDQKKVLTIYSVNHPYSKTIHDEIQSKFQSHRSFPVVDDTDKLDKLKTAIEADEPDVIILPVYGVFAGKIIRELVQSKYKGVFIGGQSWGESNGRSLDMITHGLDFEGYVIRNQSRYFLSDSARTVFEQMNAIKQFDFTPLALTVYDTLMHIFRTLDKSDKPIERSNIKEIFANDMEFDGNFGTVCLQGENCANRNYFIIRVDGNGFHPLKSLSL